MSWNASCSAYRGSPRSSTTTDLQADTARFIAGECAYGKSGLFFWYNCIMRASRSPEPPTTPPREIGPNATIIEGVAHNGRPCRIVDNTGTVDANELRVVLDTLIADRRFGMGGLSPKGGTTIPIGRGESTHIQFGDRLYRILLFAYEALIEVF